MILTTFRWTSCLRAFCMASSLAAIGTAPLAFATSGSFDEAASESSVIASGAPDVNLGLRAFTQTQVGNVLLMNTVNSVDTGTGGSVYATLAEANASQEYMIFKFDDFATVDAGAVVLGDASITFASWFTLQEGSPNEANFGEIEVYEITAGDSSWEGNQFRDGVSVSPGAVTFNSLGGTFSKLTGVTEIQPLIANGDLHDGVGVLYPGQIVGNGGFGAFQKVTGIPADTVQRLIDGTSVGLAFGGVGPETNLNIHSHDTFLNDQNKNVRLHFDWTTDALPGDYNSDGSVDAADYTVWRDGGSPDSTSVGYDLWVANFGTGTSTSTSTSVPEPTSLALIAGILATACAAGRRRAA